jgi:methyltransferase (TIGR00027 family)
VQSESGKPPGGVGDTALGAAEMRAEEHVRPDRLFDDPYAAAFVAAAPPLFPELESISDDPDIAALKAAFSADIVVRTRFYDEFLLRACTAGCRQVVLLAAGLDARAFRLDWPGGVRVFELDLPDVLAFKDAVLQRERAEPRCARTAVPVDLRDDWPAQLTAAGFEPQTRTAWTAEGLLPYLSNDDAVRLLTSVGDLSANDSRLAFEHDEFAEHSTLTRARAAEAMHEVTSLWEGGLSEHAPDWLREHDWHVQTHDRVALAREYGRPTTDTSTAGFLTATRSRRGQQSSHGEVGASARNTPMGDAAVVIETCR